MENNQKKKSKIILGILLALVAVFVAYNFMIFMEERQIQKRIQQNNAAIYNQGTTQVNGSNLGEPTDLPAYQNGQTGQSSNTVPNAQQGGTWNGKTLISVATAQQAAINAVGGGEVVSQVEDIYDLGDNPTYNFKIKNKFRIYEVEVDALTGAVIEFDVD